MGAAVALNVAARRPPSGVIVVAPFWRLGTPIQRLIYQVLKRVFRRPQPFKKADFADPRLRELFAGLLPDMEHNDPAAQQAIRQLRVPSTFADQVFAAGKAAGKAAAQVSAPALLCRTWKMKPYARRLRGSYCNRLPDRYSSWNWSPIMSW
jgi:alpha-beta hydrolase superfamily lysophospholipase